MMAIREKRDVYERREILLFDRRSGESGGHDRRDAAALRPRRAGEAEQTRRMDQLPLLHRAGRRAAEHGVCPAANGATAEEDQGGIGLRRPSENRRFSDRGGANRRQKDRRAAIQQIENTGGEAGLCAQAANRAAHGAGFRPTAAGARDYAFRRGGKAGFGRFMELSRPFLQPNRAVPTGTVRI